jgi:hypothetical protein
MKLTATEQGLLIPKELLGENQEFEIIQESEKIIIISIKKNPSFDWDQWEKRLEEAGDDPEQLTTEEICEIVREVRQEMKK